MLGQPPDDHDVTALRRPDRRRPSVAWLRDWVMWFGPARLIATSVTITGVAFAGWWLVRSPAPPTESLLPMASAPTLPVPATTPSTLGEVTVHVAGSVRHPGVYRLPSGSRVVDAIDRAGGTRRGSDSGALNLAAALADGTRVYVPRRGEDVAVDSASDPSAGSPAADVSAPPVPVAINDADAAELETLPGIGPTTAAAIVEYRTANGPFATVDDLESVPGIGPAKLDAVRDLVTL
jgi:competence protein ComEA